jgi:thiol:disulfide interchange protein
MVFYVVLLAYACFSLSVPPADLPAFIGLLVLAVCALMASKGETRRWRTICAVFLAVAVLGTTLEILSGHAIKSKLEHDRDTPASQKSP